MKELLVGGIVSAVLMIALGIFAAAGWPGDPDVCLKTKPKNGKGWHDCYCEDFDRAKVEKHEPGIRQPWNTWLNLYALGTGAFVGFFMWRQRKRRETHPSTVAGDDNRMRTTDLYPLVYLGVLIFLGLGSMWFHASLVDWGGWFDQVSMYLFAGYLWFYSLVRATNRDWPFKILYPIVAGVATIVGILGVDSLVVITAIVAGGYVACEITIWAAVPKARHGWRAVVGYWVPALLSFAWAVAFWVLSASGGKLCDPGGFQFHAIWHLMAGSMAVFLYFYWRVAPR